jgi:hypothetical protein
MINIKNKMNNSFMLITLFLLGCVSTTISSAQTVIQKETMSKYNWLGVYKILDEQVEYKITVNDDTPVRWAEYGFEFVAEGLQTYYKIKGYAIKGKDGKLELYYLETSDGVFYQADQMDINSPMFKLEKSDKIFKAINGKWNIKDFVPFFRKD